LRSYPPHIRAKWKLEKTSLVWFSNTETHDSVAPADLSKVIYIVQEFLRKTDDSVVMIEGIEYLITQNDFITVLKMVHAISDLAIIHNSRLIISLNPQVLEEKERALLERDIKIF
jgi:archaellum biogenesis ATPase FlaH